MSTATANRVLWSTVAVFAAFNALKPTPLAAPLRPILPAVSILVPLLFAAIHGTRRLGVKNMVLFFAITSVVSWGYESLSIATGFPSVPITTPTGSVRSWARFRS